MSILSKIRKQSTLLVVVIGLGLLGFVVSPQDILAFFGSDDQNTIGEVNGKRIDRVEFAQQVEQTLKQVASNTAMMSVVNTLWEQNVNKILYKEKLESTGILISENDIWQAILSMPYIRQNKYFLDETGSVDENKLKEYLITIKESTDENQVAQWQQWLELEEQTKIRLEQAAYQELILVGIMASQRDLKREEIAQETKITAKVLTIPYSLVDSTKIKITEKEIEKYIEKNKEKFMSKERTVQASIVYFNTSPSKTDREDAYSKINQILIPKEVYNNTTNKTETRPSFSEKIDNYTFYLEENESDILFLNDFKTKSEILKSDYDTLIDVPLEKVIGPIESDNYVKLHKVLEKKILPDSVRASHILIAYKGSNADDGTLLISKEEAKRKADSIFNVIQQDLSKFGEIAKTVSDDKSNSEKDGNLGWFGYRNMIKEFNAFCFNNPANTLGVVETDFGYHIVHIKQQKDFNMALKTATYGVKLVPSQETEDQKYLEVELFQKSISEGEEIDAFVEKNNYSVVKLINLKSTDYKIEGSQNSRREIVRWLTDEKTKIGAVNRFDIENGYIVAQLNGVNPKGTINKAVSNQIARARLIKDKSFDMLNKMLKKDSTLEEIASQFDNDQNIEVKTVTGITFNNSYMDNVGFEPALVGVLFASKPNKLVKGVKGRTGWIAFQITNKEEPSKEKKDLQLYNASYIRFLTNGLLNSVKISMQEKAEIDDNRTIFY